jgi:hypothetical protein
MRTKGAKNHPKTVYVKLGDLNKIFKDDAVIEVSVEYARLLGIEGVVPNTAAPQAEEKPEFRVTHFE